MDAALYTNAPEIIYLITDTKKQLVSDDGNVSALCSKFGTRGFYEMDRNRRIA